MLLDVFTRVEVPAPVLHRGVYPSWIRRCAGRLRIRQGREGPLLPGDRGARFNSALRGQGLALAVEVATAAEPGDGARV
jgi:hypothetical protein